MNCRDIMNCELIPSDDSISKATGKFDLVHSYIVFQHIPKKRGMRLIEALAARVDQGGIAAIHFIYRCNASKLIRLIVRIRYLFPVINKLRNLILGRPITDRPMQMHSYDLEDILHKLSALGYTHIYQSLNSWDNGNFEMTTLFAQRNGASKNAHQYLQ